MEELPRRIDPERTRAAILKAAEELFLEQGPSATSLREIAAKSGVNKSLIHHHFGSKDGLWHEVKCGLFQEFKQIHEDALREGVADLELLREVASMTFRFVGAHRGFVRLHQWMALEGDTSCIDMTREMFALAIAKLYEAQGKGLLRSNLDPRYLYFSLWSLCVHFYSNLAAFVELIGEPEQQLEERYLAHFLDLVLRGVASPSALGLTVRS
jgi:TetR/AcrR family transcriptional regulator